MSSGRVCLHMKKRKLLRKYANDSWKWTAGDKFTIKNELQFVLSATLASKIYIVWPVRHDAVREDIALSGHYARCDLFFVFFFLVSLLNEERERQIACALVR